MLFLSISLAAQELNELSIVGKAEKTSDIVPASIKDANNRKAACIVFLTDLEVDMDFRPNIELVKLISKAGRHEVYVQPGERVIEVFASGFKPLNVVLSSYGISKLQSGDVYQLEITGEKILDEIPITILVKPEGATIFIDDEDRGQNETFKVSSGKHNIKIVKENYLTIRQEIQVTPDDVLFKYNLQELEDALVIIKTNPDSASVYLDDVKIGITPLSKFYKPGDYNLRIEKKLCETYEAKLEITAPQTEETYDLIESYSTLTINTYEGAKVFLNGELITDLKNIKLEPMLINLKATMPKAQTIERQLVLKKNEKQTIDLYPEIATGTLQIAVTPLDAKIELKGDAGEYYTNIGGKAFKNIPTGYYDMKVTRKDHKTYEEKIRLIENEKINKQVILEKGRGYITEPSTYTQKSIEQTRKRKLKFRIKGGVNFTSYIFGSSSTGIFDRSQKHGVGLYISTLFNYSLTKNSVLNLGVLLSKQNSSYIIVIEESGIEHLISINHLYCGIPFSTKIFMKSFFVKFGLTYLIPFKPTYKYQGDLMENTDRILNNVFGLNFGFGLQFDHFVIESDFCFGVTKTWDKYKFAKFVNEVLQDGEFNKIMANQINISFGLGYRF